MFQPSNGQAGVIWGKDLDGFLEESLDGRGWDFLLIQRLTSEGSYYLVNPNFCGFAGEYIKIVNLRVCSAVENGAKSLL